MSQKGNGPEYSGRQRFILLDDALVEMDVLGAADVQLVRRRQERNEVAIDGPEPIKRGHGNFRPEGGKSVVDANDSARDEYVLG